MFKIRFLVIGCLLSVFLVNAASAQLLPRRRWARRKAELRSELVYDLSAKLDSDLAREVDAVTAQLQATAVEQVKTEAAKLDQQVQEAVAQLRTHASALVDKETKRLDNTITQQVTQLQDAAKQTVNVEAAKLKQQTDSAVNQLNQKFAERTKAMQSTVDQHLQKLPGMVTTTLQEELKKRETEVSDSAGTPPSESRPTEPPVESTPSEAANLTPETSLKEAEE